MPIEALSGLYITDAALAQLLSVGRSTIWRWVAEGKLPKPHKLAANTTRWRCADILAWLRTFDPGLSPDDEQLDQRPANEQLSQLIATMKKAA